MAGDDARRSVVHIGAACVVRPPDAAIAAHAARAEQATEIDVPRERGSATQGIRMIGARGGVAEAAEIAAEIDVPHRCNRGAQDVGAGARLGVDEAPQLPRAPRLERDESVAAWNGIHQLVGQLRAVVDLVADARAPPDVGAQPAARRDARRDLVKPLPRLIEILPAAGVGGVHAHAVPDRERELGRQSVARAREDRVERVANLRALDLGRMHPVRHRRPPRENEESPRANERTAAAATTRRSVPLEQQRLFALTSDEPPDTAASRKMPSHCENC